MKQGESLNGYKLIMCDTCSKESQVDPLWPYSNCLQCYYVSMSSPSDSFDSFQLKLQKEDCNSRMFYGQRVNDATLTITMSAGMIADAIMFRRERVDVIFHAISLALSAISRIASLYNIKLGESASHAFTMVYKDRRLVPNGTA